MTDPYRFVCPGDISRLRADAVVYSTSTAQGMSGELYDGLCRISGFKAAYKALGKPLETQGFSRLGGLRGR